MFIWLILSLYEENIRVIESDWSIAAMMSVSQTQNDSDLFNVIDVKTVIVYEAIHWIPIMFLRVLPDPGIKFLQAQ